MSLPKQQETRITPPLITAPSATPFGILLPRHQNAWDLSGEGLRHLAAAHVGDAVQSQTHEGGVPAGQVVLDGVIDQSDQLTVAVHQDRDEQITL